MKRRLLCPTTIPNHKVGPCFNGLDYGIFDWLNRLTLRDWEMALCIPVGVPFIFILIIRWSVCFPYLASTYVHARRSTHCCPYNWSRSIISKAVCWISTPHCWTFLGPLQLHDSQNIISRRWQFDWPHAVLTAGTLKFFLFLISSSIPILSVRCYHGFGRKFSFGLCFKGFPTCHPSARQHGLTLWCAVRREQLRK